MVSIFEGPLFRSKTYIRGCNKLKGCKVYRICPLEVIAQTVNVGELASSNPVRKRKPKKLTGTLD